MSGDTTRDARSRQSVEDRQRGYGAQPMGGGVGDEAPPAGAPAADLAPRVATPSTAPQSGIEPLDVSVEGAQRRLSERHFSQDTLEEGHAADADLDPVNRRSAHEQMAAPDADYTMRRDAGGTAFSEAYIEDKTGKPA